MPCMWEAGIQDGQKLESLLKRCINVADFLKTLRRSLCDASYDTLGEGRNLGRVISGLMGSKSTATGIPI